MVDRGGVRVVGRTAHPGRAPLAVRRRTPAEAPARPARRPTTGRRGRSSIGRMILATVAVTVGVWVAVALIAAVLVAILVRALDRHDLEHFPSAATEGYCVADLFAALDEFSLT